MFRAIGFLIVLWGLSQFFTSAFVAADDAARESLKFIERAAIVAQTKIEA